MSSTAASWRTLAASACASVHVAASILRLPNTSFNVAGVSCAASKLTISTGSFAWLPASIAFCVRLSSSMMSGHMNWHEV